MASPHREHRALPGPCRSGWAGVLLLALLAACATHVTRAVAGDDPSTADKLNRDAAQRFEAGDYAEAARLRQQAYDVRERLLGASNPDTLQTLCDLAIDYKSAGDYPKARDAAQRAVDTCEKQAGVPQTTLAAALLSRAEVYRATGEYAEGVPLAKRALSIAEEGGENSLLTARALHESAELYGYLGQYAQALPLAQRGLRIRDAINADSADTAESLNDLAVLYMRMADYESALPLVQRARAIREKVLGPTHPLTAESMGNLAALYISIKSYDKALPLLEQVVSIKEKRLGPDNPQTLDSMSNLAELYRGLGKSAKALELLERLAQLKEKSLGPEHPETARALNNLAGYYWSSGDYAKGRAQLAKAEAIWEKSLGPNHPDTARALNLLAALSWSAGDYAHALSYYQRGLAAEDQTLASVFAVSSEEQKLQFLERTQGHYLAALSLIQRQFRKDPAAVRFGLDLVLRHKGIVLDAQARARDAIAGHLKGDTLASWERLSKFRNDLAKLLFSGPGEDGAEPYRRRIEDLQESIASEERFLSEHSGVVAQELAQRQVTTEMLTRRLPRGATLAEFVQIRDWDEKRLVWPTTARYLAFVLTSDGRLTLVDLGDSASIDAHVASTLAAINDPNFLKDIAAYTRRCDTELAQLYQQVLQPIEAAAGASGPLIVSPDGELHKVPFAALENGDGKYLVERRAVTYVTSGRDLTRGKSGVAPTMTMLMAANPAFGDRGVFKSSVIRARPVRAPDYGPIEYPPLPGTAEEAQLIPPLVKGEKKVLQGKQATESAVRGTKSPQILHLATHGFFLKDRADDEAFPDPLGRGGHRVFRGGADGPLARSGLALAGANYADEVTEGDDGILTALEVTNMDLYGTDLAVLSACETALGQIKTGEGVYGLRRAFVLAGAHNLVMSLWPVSDKITRDLMERFYASYEKGEPVAEALRDAEVQTINYLREKTSASKQGQAFAPVNLWGPFIVQQAAES